MSALHAAPLAGDGEKCSRLYAGTPEYPAVPVHVGISSYDSSMNGDNPTGAGNQQERPEMEVVSNRRTDLWNPQRPYAGHLTGTRLRDEDMVLASWRHGDRRERNSLSGELLPHTEATLCVNPAHNGEALPAGPEQGRDEERRVTPWEALCSTTDPSVEEYGPVTTSPSGAGLRSCQQSESVSTELANLRPEQDAGSQASLVDLPSYISGYIDGEGCFTVSIAPRPTLRTGWEVRPSLSVSQNGDRAEVLLEIQQYFGCGTLRPDRSDRTLKWEIRSLQAIVQNVIPHFRRYPMRSGKQRDFELFTEICERMSKGAHRTVAGLLEIVRMAHQMNPSGKRTYLMDEICQVLSEMKA